MSRLKLYEWRIDGRKGLVLGKNEDLAKERVIQYFELTDEPLDIDFVSEEFHDLKGYRIIEYWNKPIRL